MSWHSVACRELRPVRFFSKQARPARRLVSTPTSSFDSNKSKRRIQRSEYVDMRLHWLIYVRMGFITDIGKYEFWSPGISPLAPWTCQQQYRRSQMPGSVYKYTQVLQYSTCLGLGSIDSSLLLLTRRTIWYVGNIQACNVRLIHQSISAFITVSQRCSYIHETYPHADGHSGQTWSVTAFVKCFHVSAF